MMGRGRNRLYRTIKAVTKAVIKNGMTAAVCILALLSAGCGSAAKTGAGRTGENSGSYIGAVSGAAGSVTTLDVSDMFTDRDREIGCDEEECERISLQDGTVTISEAGNYILSGEMNGSVVVDAAKTDKIRLILDGASVVCPNSAALYVKQADKVFVTTAVDSVNLLQSDGEFAAIDENNIDGAVFAKDDITFNGAGTLKIVCETGHGIVCKDDLVITSGVYEITAGDHGIQGKDSVRILSGDISVEAAQDGIHSGNDEDETVGYTYIAGGNITLKAGDDGIHSDTQLVIAGGNFTVEESYEGLEGHSVEITSGVISVRASDDGVNAAGGADGSGQRGMFGGDPFAADGNAFIIVSGGVLTVNADGDGLDSNGALYVNGGVIVIHGPEDGGNGALDYGGEAVITGGTVVALGSSHMAENFGENSTQASIMVNVQGMQAAGTEVRLLDASGEALLSCTAEKTYSCAVLSCSELEVGQNYTVVMGDQATEVELVSVIYGNGMAKPEERGSRPGGMRK